MKYKAAMKYASEGQHLMVHTIGFRNPIYVGKVKESFNS